MEREWTLDKKDRKRTEVEAFPIWECAIESDGCGGVFRAEEIETVARFNEERNEFLNYRQCPACKELHLIESNNDKQIDDQATLEKLDTDTVEQEFYKRRNWRKAKSYKELQAIGKANGYKPSWSAFKAKELGLPDTPKWVYTWKPKQQFNFNF